MLKRNTTSLSSSVCWSEVQESQVLSVGKLVHGLRIGELVLGVRPEAGRDQQLVKQSRIQRRDTLKGQASAFHVTTWVVLKTIAMEEP